MPKKKVKIRKKRVLLFIILLLLISGIFYYYVTKPIENIYIINNNILSDNEIINTANIQSYPSFILTSKKSIKKKLLTNKFIKDVKITKTYDFKLFITIDEFKVLAINANNQLILENGSVVDNIYNVGNYPYLINEIDQKIYSNFVKKFSLIDNNILYNISQIEYSPTEVDDERFLIYMIDNNYVYITLSKIKKINKYNEICGQLGQNNGIIYLDSGDYMEIKS